MYESKFAVYKNPYVKNIVNDVDVEIYHPSDLYYYMLLKTKVFLLRLNSYVTVFPLV